MADTHKYKYIVVGRKVIALSTFAGKTVRGVAICSENDEFDLEKGKELARARCNAKIAHKRFKRAEEEYACAYEIFTEARKYIDKYANYYTDSYAKYGEACAAVQELEEVL